MFEVLNNLPGALAMHPDPKMRGIRIAQERLGPAAQLMREAMFESLAANRGDNSRAAAVHGIR